MEKKIDTLRRMMESGEWNDAIKFAAKFPRLGNERDDILLARDCINNPRFYVQLGKDIDVCIEAGKAALIKKYNKV